MTYEPTLASLRRHDVLMMPSPYGRLYTTFAHDADAIGEIRNAFTKAARTMSEQRDTAVLPTGA